MQSRYQQLSSSELRVLLSQRELRTKGTKDECIRRLISDDHPIVRNYSTFSVDELKAMLKYRNLPTSGNKQLLAARLEKNKPCLFPTHIDLIDTLILFYMSDGSSSRISTINVYTYKLWRSEYYWKLRYDRTYANIPIPVGVTFHTAYALAQCTDQVEQMEVAVRLNDAPLVLYIIGRTTMTELEIVQSGQRTNKFTIWTNYNSCMDCRAMELAIKYRKYNVFRALWLKYDFSGEKIRLSSPDMYLWCIDNEDMELLIHITKAMSENYLPQFSDEVNCARNVLQSAIEYGWYFDNVKAIPFALRYINSVDSLPFLSPSIIGIIKRQAFDWYYEHHAEILSALAAPNSADDSDSSDTDGSNTDESGTD